MNIYVHYMIEDWTTGGKELSLKEACALQNEVDSGKFHPDCWASFLDLDTNEVLEPVYGAIDDSNQDYCINFEADGKIHPPIKTSP